MSLLKTDTDSTYFLGSMQLSRQRHDNCTLDMRLLNRGRADDHYIKESIVQVNRTCLDSRPQRNQCAPLLGLIEVAATASIFITKLQASGTMAACGFSEGKR